MRDAILQRRLRHRQLVIALEPHLSVLDGEDGVGAPLYGVGRAALRLAAPAPLVGEQDLGPVVVERRRVPVGEVRVTHRADANRVDRVADVEQEAVAPARAARQAERRVQRDVVALGGPGTRAVSAVLVADRRREHLREILAQRGAVGARGRAAAAPGSDDAVEHARHEPVAHDAHAAPDIDDERAPLPGLLDRGDVVGRQTVARRGHEIVEDSGRADDRRLLGMGEGHPDHLDPEERRVRVLVRRTAGAALQLVFGADGRGAGDVDVHVLVVIRMLQQGVRVRPPAGLHVGDVLGVPDVADVEDPDPAQAVMAHRLLHALGAAVEPAAESLARDEEQVLVHRDVAL